VYIIHNHDFDTNDFLLDMIYFIVKVTLP